ncbi:MAG: lysine--tRNA ligase [Candidatus Omnitrophota bacterium]
MEINEILQQRKSKLDSLKGKFYSVYPSNVAKHTPIQQALGGFQEALPVAVCGRIMAKRLHGKVAFLDLRDSTARIQLYIKTDTLDKKVLGIFEALDIADLVWVKGELFKTHTGEPTVKVQDLALLAKALRPLPEKWHGLKDVGLRYRQRYLDLLSNEKVKEVFLVRSRIIKAIRDFLDSKGYLEVETPMMHDIAGGAAGRPFKTHHNEYDEDLFLRIAPELYLKRLLVGGLDKVYEINRSFRNEGVSTRHNPEFTMLEVYAAYANYEDMMQLVQDLVIRAAEKVLGKNSFVYQGKPVDLSLPWAKRSFAQLVKDKFGIEPADEAQVMLEKLHTAGFAKEANKLNRSQIAKLIEELLEEGMSPVRNTGALGNSPIVSNGDPTFVTDYFSNLCPLAKNKEGNPFISERFELYIAGLEVGNAYTELNDPQEQKARFEQELKELDKDEKKHLDEDYILALEHGMPPAGGLGIGIDRLVMLLTDQPSIRDVILFPLLRPEKPSPPFEVE